MIKSSHQPALSIPEDLKSPIPAWQKVTFPSLSDQIHHTPKEY
jgi:hypothetical protein